MTTNLCVHCGQYHNTAIETVARECRAVKSFTYQQTDNFAWVTQVEYVSMEEQDRLLTSAEIYRNEQAAMKQPVAASVPPKVTYTNMKGEQLDYPTSVEGVSDAPKVSDPHGIANLTMIGDLPVYPKVVSGNIGRGATIAELIEHLRKFPQELKVYTSIRNNAGYYPTSITIDESADTQRVNEQDQHKLTERGLHEALLISDTVYIVAVRK